MTKRGKSTVRTFEGEGSGTSSHLILILQVKECEEKGVKCSYWAKKSAFDSTQLVFLGKMQHAPFRLFRQILLFDLYMFVLFYSA